MAVLHISPESSALVHAAAATILYLHIGAGDVGLLSGAAAFVFRKGSKLHRLAGQVFVVSMLIMSAIGAAVGDLRLILNRGVTGATRLARHLWRMTVALVLFITKWASSPRTY